MTKALVPSPAPFRPSWPLAGGVTQTAIAQLPFRTWGTNPMARCARGEILRLSGGVTLQGLFSAQVGRAPTGLVVMLSGWEGHANSPYMLRVGRALYAEGYEIFRLTYPDHGDTHDLNEAAFHFGMLDKMGEAISRVATAIRTRPILLVGFSMGGNLALNLACRGLPGLKSVFAVSPAIDFGSALRTLQQSFFHPFFLRSWKSSLERKQRLYPGRHDFSRAKGAGSVGELAQALLEKQGNSRTLEEYTARYSLTPEKLQRLTVPSYMLAATDDPIVGNVDYERFRGIDKLTLDVQPSGGHVGFIRRPWGPAYYEEIILAQCRAMQARTPSPELAEEKVGRLSGDEEQRDAAIPPSTTLQHRARGR